MFGPSLFNPWVLLGLIIAALAGAFIINDAATTREHTKVMLAWERANSVATEARAKRIADNAATMKANQTEVNNERKKQAETLERMRGNLTVALNGLRARPDRPSEGHPGSPVVAAGPGPDGGCTGTGLYRSDAGVLVREADRAQRVRAQRDACYRLYGKAQEAVNKFQCQ